MTSLCSGFTGREHISKRGKVLQNAYISATKRVYSQCNAKKADGMAVLDVGKHFCTHINQYFYICYTESMVIYRDFGVVMIAKLFREVGRKLHARDR
jgi:hypothetical protein